MPQDVDRLWEIVSEFGTRARANRKIVDAAIREFIADEVARTLDAMAGAALPRVNNGEDEKAVWDILTPDEVRELAMHDGASYRRRLAASECSDPTFGEMVAFLARVHDLVVAEDRDGDRRESRRPLAPKLDGLEDVVWSQLIFPEDLNAMRGDLATKKTCRAMEYLNAIRAELPLPGEVGQQALPPDTSPAAETGQQDEGEESPPLPPRSGQQQEGARPAVAGDDWPSKIAPGHGNQSVGDQDDNPGAKGDSQISTAPFPGMAGWMKGKEAIEAAGDLLEGKNKYKALHKVLDAHPEILRNKDPLLIGRTAWEKHLEGRRKARAKAEELAKEDARKIVGQGMWRCPTCREVHHNQPDLTECPKCGADLEPVTSPPPR